MTQNTAGNTDAALAAFPVGTPVTHRARPFDHGVVIDHRDGVAWVRWADDKEGPQAPYTLLPDVS